MKRLEVSRRKFIETLVCTGGQLTTRSSAKASALPLIDRSSLVRRHDPVLRRLDPLSPVADDELERLVRDKTPLRPAQRNVVFTKLTRPDVPGLVELIAEDLKTTENRHFGDFPIHRALLPEQLDALQKLIPVIGEQSAFVFAKLRKLGPFREPEKTYAFGSRR